MPFIIDENTLLIKGRKGDSASFTFNFDIDLTGYNIHFYVKKNVNDVDSKIVIKKDYTSPVGNALTVELTPADTIKLLDQANSYSVYFWGLKISKGNSYAQTLIPDDFSTPPMMHIYPQIGGTNV